MSTDLSTDVEIGCTKGAKPAGCDTGGKRHRSLAVQCPKGPETEMQHTQRRAGSVKRLGRDGKKSFRASPLTCVNAGQIYCLGT